MRDLYHNTAILSIYFDKKTPYGYTHRCHPRREPRYQPLAGDSAENKSIPLSLLLKSAPAHIPRYKMLLPILDIFHRMHIQWNRPLKPYPVRKRSML